MQSNGKWLLQIFMQCRYMQIFSSKTSLDKLCENTGFHLPIVSCMRTESAIMPLYGRIRVSENLYSCVFHAVDITKNNIDPIFTTFSSVIETFPATRFLTWDMVPKSRHCKFPGSSLLPQLASSVLWMLIPI